MKPVGDIITDFRQTDERTVVLQYVQPGLIGGAARLPFPWALIGIVGGLQTFGLSACSSALSSWRRC